MMRRELVGYRAGRSDEGCGLFARKSSDGLRYRPTGEAVRPPERRGQHKDGPHVLITRYEQASDDESTQEPLVLPTVLPTMPVSGSSLRARPMARRGPR